MKATASSQTTLAAGPRANAERRSRIGTALLGIGFLAIGALHALPGMIATSAEQPALILWLATSLWTFVTIGFAGAAYGLWGFPSLNDQWSRLARASAIASLVLLLIAGVTRFLPLALLDLAVFLPVVQKMPVLSPKRAKGIRPIVRIPAMLLLMYGAAVVSLHPWYQNWGATKSEIRVSMIGDPEDGSRTHLINHVVTVHASPERAWSWLIQLGEDRAGFYSYDFLERMAGTGIYNVYEIRPEWQSREAGDFLRSCPPDWMGGRWPSLTGWRVGKVEANQLLYLEDWGPMWVRPQPDGTTRLGVRTDIGDVPFLAAPIELFLFEPIHFLMEQRMLRTIRDLAENEM